MEPTTISKAGAIHQAMTVALGNRNKVAEQLGLTREELGTEIEQNPDLHTLWSEKIGATILDLADTVDRDPAPVPAVGDEVISPRDAAIVAAHHEQAHKLEQFDWEGIGIRDKETLQLMRQFEANAGRGVLRMMDTMQGGMAFAFARVSRRFADLDKRLQDLRRKIDQNPDGKENLPLEGFLHDMWIQCAKEMQKFNGEAVKASHMRLLIASRAKAMSTAAGRLRQGGWQHAKKVNGTTNDIQSKAAAA